MGPNQSERKHGKIQRVSFHFVMATTGLVPARSGSEGRRGPLLGAAGHGDPPASFQNASSCERTARLGEPPLHRAQLLGSTLPSARPSQLLADPTVWAWQGGNHEGGGRCSMEGSGAGAVRLPERGAC